MIRLAPLTDEKHITLEIRDLLDSGAHLYVQSGLHVYSDWLKTKGYAFQTMDDLYESAEDYSDLFGKIAARLLSDSSAECLYLYIGYPFDLADVLFPMAEASGVRVQMIPGVSDASLAFPGFRVDCCFTATGLPASFNPALSYAVSEVDSFLRASALKESLLEFYPAELEIRIASVRNGCYASGKALLYELDRQKSYDSTCVVYIPSVSFEKLERYGIEDLEYVMDRLRAPDGCPWDKEQTHRSIRNDFLEESYEVADALDRNDLDALCEELGDVLMHIVFHASIGKQYSEFTFRDVVTEIVRKMVFRHPHVFGTAVVRTSDEVLTNWDKLKKDEKHYSGLSDEMKRIPKCFPGLLRSRKIQSKAAKIGFDFDCPEAALGKVSEETEELLQTIRSGTGKEEEYGDLLFSVVNVGRLLHLEPEELMQRASEKFIERITRMEDYAREQGKELSQLDVNAQNELWEKTKNPHI
ncbi:MAG: nucleoside triphosphate pyrophosphohydrolase [Clostridia bacterium]|nr:nucleoside triphosphate pyrophosphohydrolase [Clostridia bacterium]